MTGRIVVDPNPADASLQPASIDLHLDQTLREYVDTCLPLDIRNPPELKSINIRRGFLLPKGDFILGSTAERVEIPSDLVAIVEGKSSLGRLGLAVHITAGFIDPGYRGHITLELHNVNKLPIVLYPGMAICQLCFETLEGEVQRPYGSNGLGSRYQDSEGTISPRAERNA